jgi:glycine/D-amino acid oxidase-like deaminating enzyme
VPNQSVAVFEKQAGYLHVESCVLAHLTMARQHGAELLSGQSVLDWSASADGVTVRADRQTFTARQLIITAGAWAKDLLADLGIHLAIRRKHLHWYRAAGDQYRADRGAPGFFYETPAGFYYGFPQLDQLGVKVAEHSGGTVISDPLTDDRSVESEDRRRVEAFLGEHLPQVTNEPAHHVVCYYTMSPDEHFVIDRHPDFPNVCFAAGLSGHGFKFTSVLGEVMAQLALDGTTRCPIGFLSCRRPGLV